MQNNINNDKKINENLILTNRTHLKLEGIVEIKNTSDTNIVLKMKDCRLSIVGDNINITKLDIVEGLLEAEGKFQEFKYGERKSLLKRLFK